MYEGFVTFLPFSVFLPGKETEDKGGEASLQDQSKNWGTVIIVKIAAFFNNYFYDSTITSQISSLILQVTFLFFHYRLQVQHLHDQNSRCRRDEVFWGQYFLHC